MTALRDRNLEEACEEGGRVNREPAPKLPWYVYFMRRLRLRVRLWRLDRRGF